METYKVIIAYLHRNKRILIVLSQKRRDPELLRFVRNLNKVFIYWVPSEVYDDLVWLYGSIKFGCPLVTNDKMTDHIYYVFSSIKDNSPIFKIWMERYRVTFDFDHLDELQLHEPMKYSCRIQIFDSISKECMSTETMAQNINIPINMIDPQDTRGIDRHNRCLAGRVEPFPPVAPAPENRSQMTNEMLIYSKKDPIWFLPIINEIDNSIGGKEIEQSFKWIMLNFYI